MSSLADLFGKQYSLYMNNSCSGNENGSDYEDDDDDSRNSLNEEQK